MIQFCQEEETSDLKKARLTNDVRYQDINEVTLGCSEYMQAAKGYFFLRAVPADNASLKLRL